MSTEQPIRQPVRSRPFRAMERVVSPVMKTVLRSPAHRLLSGSMLVMGFDGRRTGKRYDIVVGYREHDGVVEIVSPRTWWRNLQADEATVEVTFRGQRHRGRPEVHRGDETVVDVYRRLMTDSPSTARIYGVSRDPDGTVNEASLRVAVGDCAVVRVQLDSL